MSGVEEYEPRELENRQDSRTYESVLSSSRNPGTGVGTPRSFRGMHSHTSSVPSLKDHMLSTLGGSKMYSQSIIGSPTNDSLSSTGFSYSSSSNVLRNSSTNWSFGKSPRFPRVILQGKAKYRELPPTLSNSRSTGFGYGGRSTFVNLAIAGTRSPSPTNYQLQTQFDSNLQKNKGPIMGIHHKHYRNVYIPGIKLVNERSARGVPGPGAYEGLQSPIGMGALKVSLKSRIPFNHTLGNNPAPNLYQPDFKLVELNRFYGVGFGYGTRGFPTTPTRQIPVNPVVGPGTYKIPSVFDRFIKKRASEAPKSKFFVLFELYRKKSSAWKETITEFGSRTKC